MLLQSSFYSIIIDFNQFSKDLRDSFARLNSLLMLYWIYTPGVKKTSIGI